MFNMDDMEEQNTTALKISIKNLDKHMEIINKYLKNIKMALDVSMTSGCNFLKQINQKGENKTPDSPDVMEKVDMPNHSTFNDFIFKIHQELENNLTPVE